VFASEKQITICLRRVVESVGIPHHLRAFEQPLYHTDLSHDVAGDSKQMGHSGTEFEISEMHRNLFHSLSQGLASKKVKWNGHC
jgi:hypothetical protein